MRSDTVNFSAGPAGLPTPVLERAREELLDYQGCGASIMELSHRGKLYDEVHHDALTLVRQLLSIPESHDVVFMQGGATGFFGLIPLNFLGPQQSADYIMTGVWSDKALAEANRVGRARAAGGGKVDGAYVAVPSDDELQLDPDAAYVHYTGNNTIAGTQFHHVPQVTRPLVSDMSSEIMAKPLDVSKFDLIYAGAQKNLGPSGVVLCIARKTWLSDSRDDIPTIFRFKSHADKDSLLHTPPTFAIYLMRGVLRWIQEEGGVMEMSRRNQEKAKLVYDAIDESEGFYHARIESKARSVMNPVFRLPSQELEERFLAVCEEQGLIGLKGHRSVGGIRASLYNSVSVEGVARLAELMKRFKR